MAVFGHFILLIHYVLKMNYCNWPSQVNYLINRRKIYE